MKNTFLLVSFLMFSLLSFSQETKKLQPIEGKTVKSQQLENKYSNQDEDFKKTKESEEPPIIIGLSLNDDSQKVEPEKALDTEQLDKINERILVKQNLITAIDKKVAEVKSNVDLNKKAEESGWFIKMEENKNNALTEIGQLNALKEK